MTFNEWISNNFYNDSQNLGMYGIVITIAFAIMGTAIFFHELGHWLYFKLKLKKKIRIIFVKESWHSFHWEAGIQSDYDTLTDEQYKEVLLWGLLIGLLPILISGFFWIPYLFLALAYGTGVWSDLKKYLEAIPDE